MTQPSPSPSFWDEPAPEEPEPVLPVPLDRGAWLAVGAGAILAIVLLAESHLKFVFGYLTTLIHELGHTVVGWLFGYPSLPAFDFAYGGGVTTAQTRSSLLLGIVYVMLAGLLVACRRNRVTLVVLAVAAALFALCAHTQAHQVLILFMGHGMELLLAGVFLYRALSSSAVVHAVERPLYAACGFFIVFSDVAFAYRLWASPFERRLYEDAKGGGHWMDFSRIAEGYLHVSLPTVAFFFLLCCLLPVVLSFLAYRYQGRLFGLLSRLFSRESR